MIKAAAPDWITRLGRYLRGRRDQSDGDAPSSDAPGPGVVGVAEPTGSYDNWMKRFIALAEHAGIIARSSAIPVVAAIGSDLDPMCALLKETLTGLEASRAQWPVRSDTAKIVDATAVDATLNVFELIRKVLLATLNEGSAASNDPLEEAWHESTEALLKELEQLRNEYMAVWR